MRCGTVALPEGACNVVVLRSHCEDGEFALVEREDLTYVFHDGCQGDHDVSEGVAVDRTEVGSAMFSNWVRLRLRLADSTTLRIA